jgi:ribosomal protein S27AE
MPDDPSLNNLVATIRPLAAEIVALQKQMRALGMFANERELLECPRCGLMEDVSCEGMLLTCNSADFGTDTGLRFEELTLESYRCPSCGQTVHEKLSDEEKAEGLES